MRYIVNIHARTITELCEKLRARNFKWPIATVQRFSRPAENSVVAADEADGTNYDCNEAEPVEICANPICSEFCIDADLVVNIGAYMTKPQVNAFFDYSADSTSESLTISGAAIASYYQNPYELFYTASDGVTVGGEADVVSSAYSYGSSDGVTVGGEADVLSSAYQYIGGDWPYSDSKAVKTVETVEAEPEALEEVREWLNTNYILSQDSLYAITDVSWAATSDYLYARDFRLDIPDGSNIGLINASIKRTSTGGPINDLEVYFVKGEEILSPNLAKISSWPLIPTTTTYSVISDEYTSSIPGIDVQEGGWNVDDLNDEDFGILIRVQGDPASTTGTIAQIDYISLQVYWEQEEHQILRVGGSSDIVSSAWHYSATGGLEIGDETDRPNMDTFWNARGGAKVGGGAAMHYHYEGTDGVEIGGEAVTQPILAFGGGVVSGEAFVASSRYTYESTGGVDLSNDFDVVTSASYKYNPIGGISTGGSSGSYYINYDYDSDGGVTLGGSSSVRSSAWHYETDGNAIFIGGEAGLLASNFEPSPESLGFQMNIEDVSFLFGTDVDVGGLEVSTDTVDTCGCTGLPLALELKHNIPVSNKLAQFLKRNNLTMSDKFKLYYNNTNDLWQRNIHIEGLSPDIITRESWDMLFDLKCTSFVGGEEIDKEVLLFSIHIKKKNLMTLEDFATRIIVGYLPSEVCVGSDFSTGIVYDTQLNLASVSPESQIYYHRLYDDLGLFKNQYWLNNPNLNIQVSSIDIEEDQYRQNLEIVFNP